MRHFAVFLIKISILRLQLWNETVEKSERCAILQGILCFNDRMFHSIALLGHPPLFKHKFTFFVYFFTAFFMGKEAFKYEAVCVSQRLGNSLLSILKELQCFLKHNWLQIFEHLLILSLVQ